MGWFSCISICIWAGWTQWIVSKGGIWNSGYIINVQNYQMDNAFLSLKSPCIGLFMIGARIFETPLSDSQLLKRNISIHRQIMSFGHDPGTGVHIHPINHY